ncbi:hypothetical protein FWC31_02515 [Candidatus Saccharibacteria bacterium]|nr:hypothetical protein [Candidatus Saccharibacteria bacterium]
MQATLGAAIAPNKTETTGRGALCWDVSAGREIPTATRERYAHYAHEAGKTIFLHGDLSDTKKYENLRYIYCADKLLNDINLWRATDEAIARVGEPKVLPSLAHEYEDNARTAIFEAVTDKGFLSIIEQTGDAELIHRQIMQRLLNGYNVACLHPHEKARRRAEIHEEMVIHDVFLKILHGILPADTEILLPSYYPDGLDEKTATSIGYRPSNKKGMLRSTRFEFLPYGQVRRVVEQLAVSDLARITPWQKDDLRALSQPLLYQRSSMSDGVIDVMRTIEKGGERYGAAIDENTLNYGDLRKESSKREARMAHHVQELADFQRKLDEKAARGEILSSQKFQLYANRVGEIVRTICIVDPSYLEVALGNDPIVAKAYRNANKKYLAGNMAGAVSIISNSNVASREKATIICGGSSNRVDNIQNDANLSAAEKERMIRRLEQESKKLIWTSGTCIIKNCPSDGKITKVAQCKVCRECQGVFDAHKGWDGKRVSEYWKELRKKDDENNVEESIDEKRAQQAALALSENVSRVIYGDGAFDGPQKLELYNGTIIDDPELAKQYDMGELQKAA